MASQNTSGEAALSALDRLQREINTILEQTGRLFAAANQDSNTAAIAQASKLKKVFPHASERYHNALDELEDEIRIASLFMRRDLAVCLERAAAANPKPQVESPALQPQVADDTDQLESRNPAKPTSSPGSGILVGDISMTDAELPSEKEVAADPAATIRAKSELSSNEPANGGLQVNGDLSKQTENTDDSKKSPKSSLQIDTTNKDQTKSSDTRPQSKDSNKPPDTTDTFSANADLDSLFNDTASAGGDAGGGSIDFNPNDGNDFDFDHFNASIGDSNDGGNDLSSLLPGLEQYANHESAGEPDFNALFSTQTRNQQNADGDANDGSFEDFMDFADLGGGDGNGNNDGDIDFGFDLG